MALRSCPKCNGQGIIYQYGHVKGGVCFKCQGAGAVHGPRPTKAEREELEIRRPAMIAERESRRTEVQAARDREMAETGGLGPILFAAMKRQQQQSA